MYFFWCLLDFFLEKKIIFIRYFKTRIQNQYEKKRKMEIFFVKICTFLTVKFEIGNF